MSRRNYPFHDSILLPFCWLCSLDIGSEEVIPFVSTKIIRDFYTNSLIKTSSYLQCEVIGQFLLTSNIFSFHFIFLIECSLQCTLKTYLPVSRFRNMERGWVETRGVISSMPSSSGWLWVRATLKNAMIEGEQSSKLPDLWIQPGQMLSPEHHEFQGWQKAGILWQLWISKFKCNKHSFCS